MLFLICPLLVCMVYAYRLESIVSGSLLLDLESSVNTTSISTTGLVCCCKKEAGLCSHKRHHPKRKTTRYFHHPDKLVPGGQCCKTETQRCERFSSDYKEVSTGEPLSTMCQSCLDYKCRTPGFKPRAGVEDVPNPNEDKCCGPTCASYECQTHGFKPRPDVEDLADPDEYKCCEPTCASYRCQTPGYVPNRAARRNYVRNPSDDLCCEPTCDAYTCTTPGWIKKRFGFRPPTETRCCEASCASMDCTAKFGAARKANVRQLTNPTEQICCVASISDVSQPEAALSYYVFVGAWQIRGCGVMEACVRWHTEIIFCPSENIPQALAQQFDKHLASKNVPYELDWRSLDQKKKSWIACKSAFYGADRPSSSPGSGIFAGTVYLHHNSHLVGNTEGYGHKYLYGRIGPTDIYQKLREMYGQQIGCEGSWKGDEYADRSYNSNTFTEHFLGCQLGLKRTLPGMAVYGTYFYKCTC